MRENLDCLAARTLGEYFRLLFCTPTDFLEEETIAIIHVYSAGILTLPVLACSSSIPLPAI